MRLSKVVLAALTCALLGGCATDGHGGDHASSASDSHDLSIAREHAYTQLVEVRVRDTPDVIGYLVQFGELPLGVVDERPYPVGTVLVQDPALEPMGFLTPGGQAFQFDDAGVSHSMGYGTRTALIAKILGCTPNLRMSAVGPSR